MAAFAERSDDKACGDAPAAARTGPARRGPTVEGSSSASGSRRMRSGHPTSIAPQRSSRLGGAISSGGDASPDDGSRKTSMGVLVHRVGVAAHNGSYCPHQVPSFRRGGDMVPPMVRRKPDAPAGLTMWLVGSSRLNVALFVGCVSRCRASF